ncbi:hypothetical protein RRG08_000040 [Elysia crispata]|uniref:Uncharacterized protein n=1 Tax=Elysia crispata TaxID=231223 RepID=A0AAE0Y701_9GAST|nr:hypothetical protein RRG08_000040 [Elysia crispata]
MKNKSSGTSHTVQTVESLRRLSPTRYSTGLDEVPIRLTCEKSGRWGRSIVKLPSPVPTRHVYTVTRVDARLSEARGMDGDPIKRLERKSGKKP